jgi:hypothetical protein
MPAHASSRRHDAIDIHAPIRYARAKFALGSSLIGVLFLVGLAMLLASLFGVGR